MTTKIRITAERLREVLDYDPATGIFRWRLRPSNAGPPIGSVAGTTMADGYVRIRVDGIAYKGHCLAWFHVTGEWPREQIDHKNRNRAENWFDNLREATNSQNKANSTAPHTNTSSMKGVCWHKRDKKWFAQIQHNGRNIFLGYFENFDEAVDARRRKAIELHGEFVNHG